LCVSTEGYFMSSMSCCYCDSWMHVVCVCQQKVISCPAWVAVTVTRVTSTAQNHPATDVEILPKTTLCRLAGPSLPFGSFYLACILSCMNSSPICTRHYALCNIKLVAFCFLGNCIRACMSWALLWLFVTCVCILQCTELWNWMFLCDFQTLMSAVSALTLLVRWLEVDPTCKNWALMCWL